MPVGVATAVLLGVAVGEGAPVLVGEAVGDGPAVLVAVGPVVPVGEAVGDGPAVLVGEAVGVTEAVGDAVGVIVGLLVVDCAETQPQLKLSVSATSRKVCGPPVKVTNPLTALPQVSQPPVFGTAIGPVTLVPSTSIWKCWPLYGEATRVVKVYCPSAITRTSKANQSPAVSQPTE